TLKPPFRLASGSTPARLRADLEALAAAMAPARVPGLKLAPLGGFLALVPEGDSAGLARLAAETVAGLDHHRAPAPAEETTRRRAAGLSPRQEAHLATWGYPYVMDDFRFHLTLTGHLAPAALAATATALEGLIAPVLPEPFAVDALSLMGEDRQGDFHLLHRVALTG
ncbi:MAG: DUF1045 domain-containing protein, partial [Maritimibacter sp.]|nr:DUF1045 domain-containing protein [Maritimibacter sp.]